MHHSTHVKVRDNLQELTLFYPMKGVPKIELSSSAWQQVFDELSLPAQVCLLSFLGIGPKR